MLALGAITSNLNSTLQMADCKTNEKKNPSTSYYYCYMGAICDKSHVSHDRFPIESFRNDFR